MRINHRMGFGGIFTLSAVLLGLALNVNTPIWAQPAPEKTSNLSPRSLVSDQLLLFVKRSLVATEQPEKVQMQSAYQLLQLALELSPQDAELHRQMIELARQLRLPQELLQAQTAYCNLRPQDDVAQLELILLKLEALQTIDERMAAMERILDHPASTQLSAPLRSRLASAIAQGAHELGDQTRLSKRLEQAARLDPSNKQALRMIHALTVSHKKSPAEQGVALIGMLKADPLDPATRRELAEVLMDQAAYEQAAKQYLVAQSLVQQAVDDLFYQRWIQALIAAGQFDDAMSMFTGLDQRAIQQSQLAAAEAAATAPANTPAPATQPAHLNSDLEVLRLLLFHRTGRTESARQSMTRLRDHLLNQENLPDRQVQALWLTTLLAPDNWDVNVPEGIAKSLPPGDPMLARINAYILLRQGKLEQASKLLQAQPQDDPFVLFGQALALGGSQTSAGQAMLQRTVRQAPGSLAAIMASSSLRQKQIAVPAAPAGQPIVALVESLPQMIREPEYGDGKWIRLESHLQPVSYNYLDPIILRFSLRNMSEVPLSLSYLVNNPLTRTSTPATTEPSSPGTGPSGGVSSPKLMAFLMPRSGGQTLGTLSPLVEPVGRRLVLGPRETLEVDCRLDRSELGWILAMTPAERITMNGLAALDPRGFTRDGRIAIGPLGATEPIPTLDRNGTRMSMTSMESFLTMLNDADVIAQMRAIAWLVQSVPRWGSSDTGLKTIERIDQAMTERFNRYDNLRQAWMVRFLLPDAKGQPMLPRIHELAQRSEDTLVRIMYLASQVSDPKSPVLDAADRSSNPRIARFASTWRPTLEALATADAAKRAAAEAAAKESKPKPN